MEILKMNQTCPCCGGHNFKVIGVTRDRHYKIQGDWKYGVCISCNLTQLVPMPTTEELIKLYPNNFYAYNKNAFRMEFLKSILKRTIFRTNLFLDPHFKEPGRVLDYGCGTGWSLINFSKAGWDCLGIEPSPEASSYGSRTHQLNILNGTIHTITESIGNFDYIRSNHALEHDPDVGLTLNKLALHLKPGGRITIGIPNANSLAYKLFGKYWWYFGAPVHTYCFGVEHMNKMLTDLGLTLERVRFVGNYTGFLGSIQIYLNRKNINKISTDGLFIKFIPLIIFFQIIAIILNFFRMGDAVEITARANDEC